MTKIKKNVILWIGILSSIMVISSCMVTRDVMPEGFEQVIESFDKFAVEIRSVRYVVPQNTLSIDLTLNINKTVQEDVSQLLSVLTEYFRTELFVEFVEGIQEDNPEPFSINLDIYNTNNERTHMLGTDLSSNFGNWGGYFGE